MTNTPFRATGEAMPEVTNEQIEFAKDLQSLLVLCRVASECAAEPGEDANKIAPDLGRCLRWAESLCSQVLDEIMAAERIRQLDERRSAER